MRISFVLQFLILLLFSCKSSEHHTQDTTATSNGDLYLRTFWWTGMYGSSLDISWIFMDDNGNIVKNPIHGVNPVNWQKEKELNAKNTGTYVLEGDKLNISWMDGKSSSWKTEKKNGKFSIIDGGITTIQNGIPADYRLEGQYAASTVLPNVASTQTIIFNLDGSFSQRNLGTITTPDATSKSENSNSGKYSFSGNTLILEYSNGEIKKSVVTIWEMDGKKNLVINNRYFPQDK